MAVQMAKNAGCEVFVTAGSDAKLQLLKDQFGANHGINYITMGFAEEVRRICNVTDPKGGCLDLILDPIGGSQLKEDVSLLRPNGRVVAFGIAGMADRSTITGFLSAIPKVFSMLTFNSIDLLRYSKSFVGVNILHIAKSRPDILRRATQAGLDLLTQGKIRSIISQQFDWHNAGQAHQEMEERHTTGKLVFVVRQSAVTAEAKQEASPSAPASSTDASSDTATVPTTEEASSSHSAAPSDSAAPSEAANEDVSAAPKVEATETEIRQ